MLQQENHRSIKNQRIIVIINVDTVFKIKTYK